MELPIKPIKPAIFTTPVKHLTSQQIAEMPALLRDHENAVKAYHKALNDYYYWNEEQHGTRPRTSYGSRKENHTGMGNMPALVIGKAHKLFTQFLRHVRIIQRVG